MYPFLNVKNILLFYNLNCSSCFPPDCFLQNLVFDLILKWDVETYQLDVMAK